MIKVINGKTLIVYIFISILVFVFLNRILSIEEAIVFDKYYSTALIALVSLYGILYNGKSILLLIGCMSIIGILLSISGSAIFFILQLQDPYFTFEKSSYTWLGLAGFVGNAINTIIGIVIGLLLWVLKIGVKAVYNLVPSSISLKTKKNENWQGNAGSRQ